MCDSVECDEIIYEEDDESVMEVESYNNSMDVDITTKPPSPEELRNAVKRYRDLGLVVIPLGKQCDGKVPIIKDWSNATTETLIDWTKATNIGIVCGEKSGIICLDIDLKDDGVETFQALKDDNGLPKCPTQQTPNGGNHYIFKYNKRVSHITSSSKKVKKEGKPIGIDVKTNGGQFVAWPSVNLANKKQYKWTTRFEDVNKIPEMPQWLVDLLTIGELDSNNNIKRSEVNINEPTPKNKKHRLSDDEEETPSKARRTSGNTDCRDLSDLLSLIPKDVLDDYDSWIEIGMCIYNFYEGNVETALPVWRELSKESSKYKGGECESKIRTFKNKGCLKGLNSLEKIVRLSSPTKYAEYKKWEKREEVITNTPAYFDQSDPFCWNDLRKKYKNHIFSSEKEMIKAISKDLPRVLVYIEQKRFYFQKFDCSNGLHTITSSKREGFKDVTFYYRKKVVEKYGFDYRSIKMNLVKFMEEYEDHLNTYTSCDVVPNGNTDQDGVFNLWRGYKARLLPEDECVDMELIGPILRILECVWANSKENRFEWLKKWLQMTFKKPELMSKVVPCIVSRFEGVGKGGFLDFLRDFVFGPHVMATFSNLDDLLQKHNSILEGKKIVVINEPTSSGNTKSNMGKLNHNITDPTIHINPKFFNSYEVKSIANFIVATNDPNSIHIPNMSARRFQFLDAGESYQNDHEYFDTLRRECYNQKCGDHFFTYICRLDYGDLKYLKVIDTKLKEDVLESSLPSSLLFLKRVKEALDRRDSNKKLDESEEKMIKDVRPDKRIAASKFYSNYCDWCKTDKTRSEASNTEFGSQVKIYMDRTKKLHGVIMYNLATIKGLTRQKEEGEEDSSESDSDLV